MRNFIIKKEYLKEFLFLTILPLCITFAIIILIGAVTLGYTIPLPLQILIFFGFILLFKKKNNFSHKAFLRSLIYSSIIITILAMISFRDHNNLMNNRREIANKMTSNDIIFMKEAIQTNDKSVCKKLDGFYHVCEISFDKSFKGCVRELEDNQRLQCIKNVLYLTDDLTGCKENYIPDVCDEIYNNK